MAEAILRKKKLVKLCFQLFFTADMLYDFSGSTIPTVEVCPEQSGRNTGSFGVVSSTSPGRKTDFDGECGSLHRPPNLQGSDPFSQQCQGAWQMTNPWEPMKLGREFTHCIQMPRLEQYYEPCILLTGKLEGITYQENSHLQRHSSCHKITSLNTCPKENSQIGPNTRMSLFSATEILTTSMTSYKYPATWEQLLQQLHLGFHLGS